MEGQALVQQDRNPYQIMDALDDEIIKAELENRIIDTWVYSFTGSDGKFQSGLSKVGVDASCTEMAKQGNVIREGVISFQMDPTDKEYILFQGIATRYIVTPDGKEMMMESVNGTKRQWIKMKSKGKIVDDSFWYEKGAMKALRNARARLIPEEIRTKIIALAKQKGKVKQVNTTETESETTPEEKPMSDPQRKKLWAMMKSEKELTDAEAKKFFDWYIEKGETVEVKGKPTLTSQGASAFIKDFDKLFDEFTQQPIEQPIEGEGEPWE